MKVPTLDYDRWENILHVSHPKSVYLADPSEIDGYFKHVLDFWHLHCNSVRVYLIVCYDNFSYNYKEQKAYTMAGARASEFALAVVRYGGSLSQRTAARTRAIELNVPSNLYASLDEALDVVRRLKAGTT